MFIYRTVGRCYSVVNLRCIELAHFYPEHPVFMLVSSCGHFKKLFDRSKLDVSKFMFNRRNSVSDCLYLCCVN